jgi:radial spoke head protein 1
MQSDNGEKYSGGWKDNLKQGEGEYFWPNGNSFRGEYRQGKREGFGVMTY